MGKEINENKISDEIMLGAIKSLITVLSNDKYWPDIYALALKRLLNIYTLEKRPIQKVKKLEITVTFPELLEKFDESKGV